MPTWYIPVLPSSCTSGSSLSRNYPTMGTPFTVGSTGGRDTFYRITAVRITFYTGTSAQWAVRVDLKKNIAGYPIIAQSDPKTIGPASQAIGTVQWSITELPAPQWILTIPANQVLDALCTVTVTFVSGDSNAYIGVQGTTYPGTFYPCFEIDFEVLNPRVFVWDGSNWVARPVKSNSSGSWRRGKILIWDGSRWVAIR